MKRTIYFFSFVIAIGFFMSNCQRDIKDYHKDIELNLPAEPFDYVNADWNESDLQSVQGIPQMLTDLGVKNTGATLGRVLFYDTRLSLNNRVSCASCHDQKSAFSDSKEFSTGFENRITDRNSMAIVNPVFNNSLFWDSRAASIEDLVSNPILNHIEMGMETMDQLAKKLSNVDFYKPLFKDAYGSEEVTENKIIDAMSMFLKSMVSLESGFDIAAAAGFNTLTVEELKGMELFFSENVLCASCHNGFNFSAPDGEGAGSKANFFGNPTLVNENFQTTNEYGGNDASGLAIKGTANIGLDVAYADNGLRAGQFKIPTLRNIEMTAPYMHDGRFETLEEVVEHYSSDIQLHENLDDKFKSGDQTKPLNLNQDEKKSLVAFLKLLTDEKFITAERFSDPFVR